MAITRGLWEMVGRCTQNINVWFPIGTPPHTLAMGFLHQSERFILKLMSGFMELWYKQLQATSDADDVEAWLIVCYAVQAIYHWMREVRVSAGGVLDHGDKLEVTVDILWATELCHTKMHELTLAEFRHHHIVSTSLNIHLFEHRVPLTVRKKVLKRVEALENVANSFLIKSEAARKQK